MNIKFLGIGKLLKDFEFDSNIMRSLVWIEERLGVGYLVKNC